jgi:hypothetical protein
MKDWITENTKCFYKYCDKLATQIVLIEKESMRIKLPMCAKHSDEVTPTEQTT